MEITGRDALIVVDVQNDFCPGGALAVPDGDAVIPMIDGIAPRFEHIVVTQDWHPRGHCSFASRYEGKKPFEVVELASGEQRLWPDHCVQGTRGAELHPDLRLERAEMILRKGFRKEVDSYSAFFENDHTTPTGLAGYCQERGLERMFFAGLAYDFCVGFSALDARRSGFEAVVIRDACRGIDVDGSVERMEAEFARDGVWVVGSGEISLS
ncbi:MAG TPA: bifunctional nicotinamidase/pyrazinamidase [Acidobacteriaceae bacterium]|jgi:nicotinamidase/pyrazinamidase|nr:bifunctional nicotinamidase/pyrazinamidase [Acidobacteriaceae bacterium]